jgi:hypothetical protein
MQRLASLAAAAAADGDREADDTMHLDAASDHGRGASSDEDHSMLDHSTAAHQQQAAEDAAMVVAEGRRKRAWDSSEHLQAASPAPHAAAAAPPANRLGWVHGSSSGLRGGELLGRHVRVWVARQQRWLEGCVVAYSAHTVS